MAASSTQILGLLTNCKGSNAEFITGKKLCKMSLSQAFIRWDVRRSTSTGLIHKVNVWIHDDEIRKRQKDHFGGIVCRETFFFFAFARYSTCNRRSGWVCNLSLWNHSRSPPQYRNLLQLQDHHIEVQKHLTHLVLTDPWTSLEQISSGPVSLLVFVILSWRLPWSAMRQRQTQGGQGKKLVKALAATVQY